MFVDFVNSARTIGKHIPVKYLLVKEIVGPVHSAQDPLRVPCPTRNAGLNKINK